MNIYSSKQKNHKRQKIIIFFYMLLAALLCSASQQQICYVLTGTIKGAHDGDTVKLCYYDDWNVVTVKQTLVKNGKYEFVGRQDTAVLRYVTCNANGESLGAVQFVLENEYINVDLDNKAFYCSIKGSDINEAWCAFRNESERLNSERMEFYYQSVDKRLSFIERQEKKRQQQIMDKEIVDYRLQFCKQHISNITGAYCLAVHYKDFDPNVVAELVTHIPPTCNMKEVLALKEIIANKKKTAEGQPFTDFAMKTPDGTVMSVNEVAKKNKVTMVGFWASFSSPSKADMPFMKAAYDKYHSKGFEIVGVSLDSDVQEWKRAIADLQLEWLHMSDLKGWKSDGAVIYGIKAIPSTILIQNGKIIARDVHGDAIEAKLSKLLN